MPESEVRIGVLSGTFFEPESVDVGLPGILFVHGSGSNQTGYFHRAAAVSKALACVCLTFDLTGHGHSASGARKPSLRNHLEDVESAYDALVNQPLVDPARIGICGASYGAYLAAWMPSRRAVRRLLLRAPGLYDDDSLDIECSELESRVDADVTRLFAALNQTLPDVLLLESGRDEVVPHEVIEVYLSKYSRTEYGLIADATHALVNPEWDQEFIAAIIDWFRPL